MSEEMLRSYEELRAEFSTACAELEKERERREKAEAERDRLREALESLVKCHANGGFVEPDEDVLTRARSALVKPAGGES